MKNHGNQRDVPIFPHHTKDACIFLDWSGIVDLMENGIGHRFRTVKGNLVFAATISACGGD